MDNLLFYAPPTVSRYFMHYFVSSLVFLYPATLKSGGYYVIPSIQKMCLRVRLSAHCVPSLMGASFNQFSSNLL